MKEGEEGSNKVLLLHDVPYVAGGVDARYYKEMENANSQAAGLVAHEVAVPANHSGRKQAEGVHGCYCMGSAALLRSRKDKELKNRDEDLSNHLHVAALEWM